jgi:uncharacterized protein with NAD-binding domain and iron-sulfur cluster
MPTDGQADMPETPGRTNVKVVIVGGGCAGLAAAWQLAKLPDYEVHLYERSWRLGGKGASGRDNQGRILEHGLHIWLGFYENAFRMMRECYAEVEDKKWGPNQSDPGSRLPHGSIDDAFFAEPHIGVAARNRANEWEVWSGYLPPMKGRPGDPFDAHSNPFTLTNYIARCLHLLNTLMVSVIGPPEGDVPGTPRPDERSTSDEAAELDFSYDAARSPRALVEHMARMLRGGILTTAAGLLQGVTMLEDWIRTLKLGQPMADTVFEFVEAVAAQTRKLLRDLVAVDEHVRRKTEIIDLVMTIAVGLYRDRVLFDERGLDAINNIDYREWLTKHGATRTSVASPFVEGIYDLVFAYRDGDHDRPALAAGVALRGALRMFFTYRGAMFYRMRSGMGETVFSPLYKVLGEKKGSDGKPRVIFHFQHALQRVEFDFSNEGGARVQLLKFSTAGDPKDLDKIGQANALDHFGCWPEDDRLFTPARSGMKLETLSLEADEHFDVVIFALGIDDFVRVCELDKRQGADDGSVETERGCESDNTRESGLFGITRWRNMRRHVKTVATKAAQVWLAQDLEALGWYRGPAVISAMGEPFATWADMTYTLASEQAWRDALPREKGSEPLADSSRSVAAFCSELSDEAIQGADKDPHKVKACVEHDLKEWLSKGMRPFWPHAFAGDRTSLDQVVSLKPVGQPAGDLSGQHIRANFEDSERYTLALPGSIEHRISPLDRSVTNMTIAGDWTACGLDAGCVEAAVMSGMLAVHAITGSSPSLDEIVGYHHP